MKICNRCKAQVKDDAMFCNYCGNALSDEPTKRFCPACGAEASEGSFCPKCGYKLSEEKASEPLFDFSEDTAGYEGFDAMIKARRADDGEELRHANMLCIRGEFEAAEKLIRPYVDKYYDRVEGYIALLRVHSKDFTEFEGEQIEKDFKIIGKLSGGSVADADYKAYLLAREKYFEDKAEEETRKRREKRDSKYKEALWCVIRAIV